jgi:WD40 repeat protein
VTIAAFSPDGQKLAMALLDGVVKVWDAVKGTACFELPTEKDVQCLIFSRDGA